MTWRELLTFYENHLLRDVMPFWLRYGLDETHGGVFNFIGNEGLVTSTDKVLWSQARALWTFSSLYNDLDHNPAWLDLARGTANFMLRHGREHSGAWAFRLTRDGGIIEPSKSVYVDAFVIYGFTEYVRATGDQAALAAALETWERTSPLLNNHDALPTQPHAIPAGFQSHGPSMIFALVYHELGVLTGDTAILQRGLELAEIVMTQHLRPEHKLLYEFVKPGGELAPGDVGGTFLPGHAIESMWFMDRIFSYHGDTGRAHKALQAIEWHLDKGWDREYGGLYLACHAAGGAPVWHSPQSKCWWPMTESLYALLRSVEALGEEWCTQWYWKVHDYTFSHFPNRVHGDWFQNLDRQGQPTAPAVANLPVKDPFHLPRSLIYSISVLRRLAALPEPQKESAG